MSNFCVVQFINKKIKTHVIYQSAKAYFKVFFNPITDKTYKEPLDTN